MGSSSRSFWMRLANAGKGEAAPTAAHGWTEAADEAGERTSPPSLRWARPAEPGAGAVEGSEGQGWETVHHGGQTKGSRITATWDQALAPGRVTWDGDGPS